MYISPVYTLLISEIALVYGSPSQSLFQAATKNHGFYDVQVGCVLKVTAFNEHNLRLIAEDGEMLLRVLYRALHGIVDRVDICFTSSELPSQGPH